MPIQLKEKNNQFYLQSRLLCGLRDRRSSGRFISYSDRPPGTELLENERRMEDDKNAMQIRHSLVSLGSADRCMVLELSLGILRHLHQQRNASHQDSNRFLFNTLQRDVWIHFLFFAGIALCANGIGSIVVLGMGSSIILRLGPTYTLALSLLISSFRLAVFYTVR